MNDRKDSAGETGSSRPWTLVAAAIGAVVVMGAAVAVVPPEASPQVSSASGTAFAGPSGYLPDQIANQAKEIEPMPEMYY